MAKLSLSHDTENQQATPDNQEPTTTTDSNFQQPGTNKNHRQQHPKSYSQDSTTDTQQPITNNNKQLPLRDTTINHKQHPTN
jgi:hypothetical protein